MVLTGTIGDEDDLPTYQDHPRNLFTLLGEEVPVRRYESVTDMCPPSVCDPAPRQPLSQAIEDASVVYGHRVLPSSLRDELPAIDNSWGAYGAEDDQGRGRVRRPPAETSGQSHIAEAYSRWLGLEADERSPRGPGRHPARRDRGDRRVAVAALRPRRPAAPSVGAVPHGDRHVVRAGADHRPRRPRVRVRRPPRRPAARACRSAPSTRWSASSSTTCVAADVGADAARRHVGPRQQPHASRHRTDEGHRRQPRGGVPGAAVRQGAGTGRRARSATTAPR